VNTAYALSLDSLVRLGGHERFAQRAARVREAMLERLWDERSGLFLDEAADGPLRVSTWPSLAPLALTGLPTEVTDRLIDEHLLNERRYWLRYPVTSTAADEPSFRPSTRLLRYWRGPTWMATSWLMHRALRLHGRHEAAQHLASRIEELVSGRGFREYYDPNTGEGMGARAFGMSTLALLIAQPETATASA
jgi:glycogen debranching enzyme